MSVGFVAGDGGPSDAGDLSVVYCTNKACLSIDIRIRTSTTQRLEGGRPLATLECLSCGHSWKIIGTVPVRALVMRLQHPPVPARRPL
jgi:hypothetical protein